MRWHHNITCKKTSHSIFYSSTTPACFVKSENKTPYYDSTHNRSPPSVDALIFCQTEFRLCITKIRIIKKKLIRSLRKKIVFVQHRYKSKTVPKLCNIKKQFLFCLDNTYCLGVFVNNLIKKR